MTSKSTLICAALAATVTLSHAQMTLLSHFSANQSGGFSAGEIAAFDKGTDRLFVTSSGSSVYRINIFNMANPLAVTGTGTIDFSTAFGATANMRGLSSVAVNSDKGFGVAALLPTANATTAGKIGYFNLATGAVIGTVDVGFHPDSVSFSPDGSRLIVVNEGEFNANTNTGGTGNLNTNSGNVNAPGSLTVVNVSTINSGNLANLTSLTAVTRDFSSGNLGAGVNLNGIRNSNLTAVQTSGTFINAVPDFSTPAIGIENAIEPEYASVIGDKVYVSLQDNNAIGEYDLTTDTWTKVTSLGTITQTIDANNTGSPVISISQSVKGLPMPDTIATYTAGGKTYVVTANEGDARNDDRDLSRFGDVAGIDNMNPLVDTDSPSNFLNTGTNANNGVRSDAQLGRLNISRLDGDTDGDGKIDAPTMIGTRSMSIWEVTAGGLTRVYDSGSFFETYIRDNDAAGWVDDRSDDKGPEPEGLTLGEIEGRTYAFIGMERTNGILMLDVTNPTNVTMSGYQRVVETDGSPTSGTPHRPESLSFVSAADSPNGQNLLIVGFEGTGNGSEAASERIAIFSVVPEPSTALLLGVAGVALALRRRARRVAA